MRGCNQCGYVATDRESGSCPKCKKERGQVVLLGHLNDDDAVFDGDEKLPFMGYYDMTERPKPTFTYRMARLWRRISGKESAAIIAKYEALHQEEVHRRNHYRLEMTHAIEAIAERNLKIVGLERAMADSMANAVRQHDRAEKAEIDACTERANAYWREVELRREASHLRGQITKLKKKLAATTAAPMKGRSDG